MVSLATKRGNPMPLDAPSFTSGIAEPAEDATDAPVPITEVASLPGGAGASGTTDSPSFNVNYQTNGFWLKCNDYGSSFHDSIQGQIVPLNPSDLVTQDDVVAGPSGEISRSALFAGGVQNLGMIAPTQIDLSGELCFAEWIYPTTLDGGGHTLLNHGAGAEALDIYINASQQVEVRVGGTIVLTGTTALSTSTWYHVAVVRVADNTMKVYIGGGTPEDTAVVATDLTEAQGTAANIGMNALYSGPFIGRMANIRLRGGQSFYSDGFTPPTVYMESIGELGRVNSATTFTFDLEGAGDGFYSQLHQYSGTTPELFEVVSACGDTLDTPHDCSSGDFTTSFPAAGSPCTVTMRALATELSGSMTITVKDIDGSTIATIDCSYSLGNFMTGIAESIGNFVDSWSMFQLADGALNDTDTIALSDTGAESDMTAVMSGTYDGTWSIESASPPGVGVGPMSKYIRALNYAGTGGANVAYGDAGALNTSPQTFIGLFRTVSTLPNDANARALWRFDVDVDNAAAPAPAPSPAMIGFERNGDYRGGLVSGFSGMSSGTGVHNWTSPTTSTVWYVVVLRRDVGTDNVHIAWVPATGGALSAANNGQAVKTDYVWTASVLTHMRLLAAAEQETADIDIGAWWLFDDELTDGEVDTMLDAIANGP